MLNQQIMATNNFIVLTEEQLEEKIYNELKSALQELANIMKPISPE